MIEGLQNFRDTGGTPLDGGGATRSGVLYRSEALSALTPGGLDALAATDIGVIADFRTEVERGMAADRLPDSRPFRVVDLPLLEGALTGMAQQAPKADDPNAADAAAAAIAAAVAQLPGLGDLYVSMLAGGAASFAALARLIAASTDDAPSAVLVHCTAGKDRTGVAVALMLDTAGADRDAVVADYASSAAHLAGAWADRMRAMVTAMGVPLTPTIDTLLTGTPAAAIEQALAWTDERGGAAAYLQSGGLTDSELEALRARLVA
ncbi:tyrosine-protein phosphatase [Microbacterium allomyrinae]|jgi:protein-tyrosine phosphatase|uniref:Tyrosine-protein phosphatase n=1 Tax=Microbacterium allomyrinae TaxID=2830666 RepID=A0A9X1LST8_9MICO|nr:tyrosine-protein phosphatase [Microbacterium allomyrinae]MCC2031330.1 tyrosine-protein phosphatase [Microbacterium allomyrinae]